MSLLVTLIVAQFVFILIVCPFTWSTSAVVCPASCSVAKGSIADSCGLKVGDQVLDVNGHSFRSILHAEAVSILKAYPTLMITVKVCMVYVRMYVYLYSDFFWACIHTYVHTYIHSYVHMYIHTYICMYIRMYSTVYLHVIVLLCIDV